VWLLAVLAFADWASIERSLTAGKYLEALSQLEADREDSIRWHLLASKAQDGLNHPAEAVAEAEAALRIDPRSEPAHIQLGFIFLSRNTPVAAAEIFTDAEKLFPRSLVARLGRGLALKELQRYDDAERTLANCWPHPLAFDALATILIQRGKFVDAKQLSQRFIETNPADYRGYYFVAAAKDGLQESDAQEAARQSLQRKGDFAAAHALLGKIQLRNGDLIAAVASLEQAIRHRPDLVQAHLHLGQAFRKLGRLADATREFETVSRLKKDEAQQKPSLRYHRGHGAAQK
jgi:Tfp pilus assembly protein PilF